jgi:putative transposase
MPPACKVLCRQSGLHVLNRGNCRMNIFGKPGDYGAFIKILEEGRQRTGMRILAYCLMGDHYESQEVDTREDPGSC